MLEIKIKVECPDILMAATVLAKALTRGREDSVAPVAAPQPVSTPVMPTTPAAPVNPTPAPVATPIPAPAPAAPAQTAAPTNPAPAVPVTTAPTYTLDQISRAGAALVDAGKMDALLGLLAKFGVAAVTQLQPEQYGTFATELRGLGAQI